MWDPLWRHQCFITPTAMYFLLQSFLHNYLFGILIYTCGIGWTALHSLTCDVTFFFRKFESIQEPNKPCLLVTKNLFMLTWENLGSSSWASTGVLFLNMLDLMRVFFL